MNFDREANSIKQKTFKWMLNFLMPEKNSRTKLVNIISFMLHFLDYFIILLMVSLQQNTIWKFEKPFILTLVLQVIRIACNIAYMFTKLKYFLISQRILMVINILSFPSQNMIIESFPVFFDFAASLVWILTIDQKNVSFDSRLYIEQAVIKKVLVYLTFLYWLNLRNTYSIYGIVYITFSIGLLIVDINSNFYDQNFKKTLLSFDMCAIFSSILPVLLDFFIDQASAYQKIILMLMSIGIACAYSYIRKRSYKILFQINPWKDKIIESDMLQYFVTLEHLFKNGPQKVATQFMWHHVRICQQPKCALMYHYSVHEQSREKLKNSIRIFWKQQLLKKAKKIKILQDFVIHNCYDLSSQIATFYDQSNFFHFRERSRFISLVKNIRKQNQKNKSIEQQLNQSQQQQSAFNVEIDITPKIKNFLTASLEFWSKLTNYNIDAKSLVELGTQKLIQQQQIQKIIQSRVMLSLQSQIVLKMFYPYILNETSPILPKIQDKIEYNLQGYTQSYPTLVVSAERQTFLQIVDANSSFVKASGYTKKELQEKTVDYFWDQMIRQDHIKMAKKITTQSKFQSGELARSYAFIKDKQGYIIPADGRVYYLDNYKGKKWYVVLEPYLNDQKVLVFNRNGELLGFSQNCNTLGLSTDMNGGKIKQKIFNEIKGKQKFIKMREDQFFMEDNNLINQGLNKIPYILKCESEIFFNGKPCFYMYSIKMRKEDEKTAMWLFQSVKLTKGIKKLVKFNQFNLESQLKKQEQLLQNVDFQFNFDILSIKFFGQKSNKMLKQNYSQQLRQNSIKHEQSFIQAEQVPYSEGITQMRLWNNQLDFLQNLKVVQKPFEDQNPQKQIQYEVVPCEKIKQNFRQKQKKAPYYLIYLRIYYFILACIIAILTIYINIAKLQIQNYSKKCLFQSNLLYTHINLMTSLSTIIISQNYDSSLNISELANSQNTLIEQSYTNLQQNVQNFTNIKNQMSTNNKTMKEQQDLYRMFVHNKIVNSSVSNDQVIAQLLNYVYKGWIQAMDSKSLFQRQKIKQSSAIVFYLCICTVGVVLILYFAFLRMQKKMEKVQSQICKLFISMPQEQVIKQTFKFKSFISYINFGSDLLDEEELSQICHKFKNDKIHQKKMTNLNTHIMQKVFIFFNLLIFYAYMGISTYRQINEQYSIFNYIQIMNSIEKSSLKMSIIWVGLNQYTRNGTYLLNLRGPFEDEDRVFQYKVMQGISNDLYSEQMKDYLIRYCYGDVCESLSQQNCTLNVNQTQKDGNKYINTLFLMKFESAYDNKNLTSFQASTSAQLMYTLQKYYYSQIGHVSSTMIQQSNIEQIEQQKVIGLVTLTVLIACLVLMTVSYFKLSSRIRQLYELEKIFTWMDNETLNSNKKYIKFYHETKILLR